MLISKLFRPLLFVSGLLWGTFAVSAPLTSNDVVNVINCLAEIQAIGDEFVDLDDESAPLDSDPSDMFSSLVEQSKSHPAFHKLESIIEDNGFESPEAFGAVADRVMAAAMAIQVRNDPAAQLALNSPRTPGDIDAYLQNLPKDLPQEMRADIEQNLRSMATYMNSVSETVKTVPEEDIQAVYPHLAALYEWMGDDEDGSNSDMSTDW
ncbi:hypothetical protein LPB19_03750 [Marinobacter salinisoli]|uniref:DUF2059 domain-containing protein n=1 Tax=Marinobacter salinisoli TaxID=2769486 RepID=A0ABX7MT87_9GAMM|nr:hypothetical protein [Marinobacter salinisoli]QSP95541.1 hypothetical protein LPB19_03750 [Marinobacter salinisoli]